MAINASGNKRNHGDNARKQRAGESNSAAAKKKKKGDEQHGGMAKRRNGGECEENIGNESSIKTASEKRNKNNNAVSHAFCTLGDILSLFMPVTGVKASA